MLVIVKKYIYKIIQLFFGLLMLSIAVATIFLDKSLNSAFPNTVTYANGGYYFLAFMIIVAIFFLHRCISGQYDISKKTYMIYMVILPIVVWGGVQIPIGKWIYWFTNAGDFGSIMYAAIGFNSGETFVDWPYFLQSPNNANLAIALSWVYRFLPNWRYILILGATLTNISAVLVSLTVKNITKNRMASLCVLILGELLMAMTWRAFIVYTDNYGMIFVALIIWVYSLELADKYKMPVVIILAAAGTFIKITIFICFLAILIHKFCISLKSDEDFKHNLRGIVLFGLVSIVIFGLMIFAQKTLRRYHGLDLSGQYPKAWQYMFMVGQNSDVYGVTNREDLQIRNEIIEDVAGRNEDVNCANQQFLVEALKRVERRGVIGNINFLIKKLNVAYNDGYFHNVQASATPVSNELEHNIYFELLEKENGAYYQISAGILQIAWDFVLLLLMFSVLLLSRNDIYKLFEIIILGVTVYLMLFEGRSKYLYMFLPVFVTAAGISFAQMDSQLLKIKEIIVMAERNDNVKKRRVGIITFHFVNNFGGVLQAYALRRVVERECNVEAEIIDYRNWFICLTDRIRLLPISVNLKEIISGFKTMKQRIERRKKFGNFTKENNKLTKKYMNHWQINSCPPYDDKYICGSDQIWNPFLTMGVNSNYFLGFESDSNKKIAYAPSFGTNGMAKRYKKKIKKYLESIRYLSVREKSGQELIKGMTGCEAERLIDPACLLTKEEWGGVIGVNLLDSDEPYILLYIMQRDMEVYEYARKIKQQMGIQLVEISRYGFQPGFVDKVLVDVGPAEFLRLFRDATYICTNSYHGLVYSIIFEKDFCLIPCKRFKARINNMLDLLQIETVIGGDDWKSLTASYDKQFVRGVIEKERVKAIKFLIESVGSR